jgi:hypothetical protein
MLNVLNMIWSSAIRTVSWLTDDAYLRMDKIAFPNHMHGAWDFYHDQLFDQEYYKEDMKNQRIKIDFCKAPRPHILTGIR